MKIDIIAASKIKLKSHLSEYISNYLKRFTTFSINIIEFDDKNFSKEVTNQKIFSLGKKNSYKIILDEKGISLSSIDFKNMLEEKYTINNHISFLIAGSDGFLPEYKNKADTILSLSKLTFPHQMARLILVEQLYRSQCLINKHPYHRE